MDLSPPVGSRISWVAKGDRLYLDIPRKAGFALYCTRLFLLFWLALCARGFNAIVSTAPSAKVNGFFNVWLGGLALGGVTALIMLCRAIQRLEEWLAVLPDGVNYGVPRRYAIPQVLNEAWNAVARKWVTIKFDLEQLQSLRLRKTEAGNSLTIDVGAERHEIAANASAAEREWLARLLAQRYALTQVMGSGTNPPR